jgi:hypothetical protein
MLTDGTLCACLRAGRKETKAKHTDVVKEDKENAQAIQSKINQTLQEAKRSSAVSAQREVRVCVCARARAGVCVCVCVCVCVYVCVCARARVFNGALSSAHFCVNVAQSSLAH